MTNEITDMNNDLDLTFISDRPNPILQCDSYKLHDLQKYLAECAGEGIVVGLGSVFPDMERDTISFAMKTRIDITNKLGYCMICTEGGPNEVIDTLLGGVTL